MLELTITTEMFDENTSEFINDPIATLRLEHSLVSLSKWEEIWHKPFMTKEEKTVEEVISYIKCMTLTQNVNPNVYNYLTNEHLATVVAYIDDPHTATTIKQSSTGGNKTGEQITAELIYYNMIELNIPVKFEKWHLNRLITLIDVCKVKRQPEKKMSARDTMAQNRALNAQRRAQMKSKG